MRCSISFLLVKKFVYLHPFYYFCTMQQDNDSSASGYLGDAFEGISQTFTDIEILSTSEVNVVAKAKRYGRWWLLKGLRKEVAGEAAYQQRLRKELELLMELQHPAVVSAAGLEMVEPLGECIVMEYVDGVTMKEWLKGHRKRQTKKRILRELIDAVGYIHAKGVVHRDLKPENILITHNGENVKLIDFGLADTDSYSVLKQPAGTPRYMSPEQKQTAQADVRNDIYSLGVIMQQMGLGYTYHIIINRCMKPIGQRYQNTKELLYAMERIERNRRITLVIGCCLLILLLWVSLMKGLLAKTDGDAIEMKQEAIRTETDTNYLYDSITKVDKLVEKSDELQPQQPEQRRVEDAIKRGRQFISECVAKTGMNEHIDTLTSVLYLRQDFGAIIQSSNTWVDKYLQALTVDYSPMEISEIRKALLDETGTITEKWGKKVIQLKEAYDSQFMP